MDAPFFKTGGEVGLRMLKNSAGNILLTFVKIGGDNKRQKNES